MRLRVSPKHVPLLATAVVLVGIYAIGSLCYPGFFSLRVAVYLLGDNAYLGVAAIGATFVILSGGIDLSVGAVVAFTGMLIAVLLNPQAEDVNRLIPWLIGPQGVHPLTAMAVALVIGTLFGAGMGLLIHLFSLPPFLVTLAGMFLARGMSFVLRPQSLGIKHAFYGQTINQTLAIPLGGGLEFPFTATGWLAVCAAALVIAHHTRFGRAVYALGGDEQSAVLMSLPVGRTKVGVYALAGFLSALAGLVHTFYKQSGDPLSCVGFELDAIAATVIGGTLLTGGVGFVAGTFMGVLILGLIQQIITFQGTLSSWWTSIVVGALLLLFIGLQNVVTVGSRRFRFLRGAAAPSRPGPLPPAATPGSRRPPDPSPPRP